MDVPGAARGDGQASIGRRGLRREMERVCVRIEELVCVRRFYRGDYIWEGGERTAVMLLVLLHAQQMV